MEDPLFKLKDKIEKELREFFDDKIKQAKKQEKPEEFLEMVKNLRKFTLNSGKRIRPILFYYSYLVAGGEKKENALKASISMELIHSYLLIHDDIIDRDNFRRGDLSMHCRYEKEYGNKKFNFNTCSNEGEQAFVRFHLSGNFKSPNNIKHFGTSMAIITGDLASSFGYEILTHSNFPADLKIKAIEKLNQIVSNTMAGEAIDVILAKRLNADINEVIKMQGYKTAKYTIEGPLHLGAILAGADGKFLKAISEFSIPLGIAFQIQDDIIGVFGNEKRIGKPVGADIKEGKKTLLSVKAFERADKEQLKILSESFGNKNINLNKVNIVREIIKKTGSLDYSSEKAKELIKFSKARLEEMEISEKRKKSLLKLADFVAERRR